MRRLVCKICGGITNIEDANVISGGEYYCRHCRTIIVLLNEYMQRNPDLVYEMLKEYKNRITEKGGIL